MKKLILGILVLAMAAAAAAQPFVWPENYSRESAADVVTGGTWQYYSVGEPRTLNPVVTAESTNFSNLLFNQAPLVRLDIDMASYIPYSAASFEISEDGRTMDFVLRDGLTWSDGSPITVQDYYATFLLETDEAMNANGYSSWFMDGDPITLEITGENTLRLNFPRANRQSMGVAGVTPIPDKVFGEAYRSGGVEAVQALWGTDVDVSSTIWAGAFVPVSYVPGERIVWQANPYFGAWNVDTAGNPVPYLDQITMQVTESVDTALNLYLAGQIDYFPPANLDQIGVIAQAIDNGDLDAEVHESVAPAASSQFITWNWNMASNPVKQELFRNVNFRRAMAHLTDRETMGELVYNGAYAPMYTGVYPTYEYWTNPDVETYPFDPERAGQLLDEIGWQQRSPGAVRTNANGDELTYTLVTNAGNSTREQLAAIFGDTAREIGVNVDVQYIDFNIIVDQLFSTGDDRAWDAILIGLTNANPSFPFGPNVIPCGESLHMYNTSGACISPQESLMGALFNRGRETIDDDAALQIGYEMQQVESEFVPILYTVSPMLHYSWISDLAGQHPEDLINGVVGAFEPELLFKR